MQFVSKYIVPVGREGLHTIQTGKWRTRRPVLDAAKCVKCGVCLMYCPVNSIKREENGAFTIDYEYCKGCGICAAECKKGAIAMTPEKEDA